MDDISKLYYGFVYAGITRIHLWGRLDTLREMLKDSTCNFLAVSSEIFETELALFIFKEMERRNDQDTRESLD